MKTLTESIIGRKGSEYLMTDIGLIQGDIVYFKTDMGNPYMVIIDDSLYKSIMYEESIDKYDCSKGVFLSTTGNCINFMTISDYNKGLKCSIDSGFNIQKAYRGHSGRISPENIAEVVNTSNLEKMVKYFRLIFKDGRWL